MKYKIASIILGITLAMSNMPVAYAQTAQQADTTAPTLAGITPVTGTTVPTGTLEISAQGVYDPSGVKSVSFVVYNQAEGQTKSVLYIATNTGSSEWSNVISTSDLANMPGTYVINVIGTDAYDNQGIIGSTSIVLSADNGTPALESVSPASGTVLDSDTQSFTVQAKVTDISGVKAVSFTAYNEVDGESGSVSLGGVDNLDGSWSQNFSLSSFGSETGKFIIEVWALDKLGNVGLIGNTDVTVQKPVSAVYSNKVEAFISAAMSELGKSYVLGGKGPDVFDCSGLVYYSLKSSGNTIFYMTSAVWAQSGYQRINSMNDLQRGDVICFKGHVGIYLGNGSMINASYSNRSVIISNDILSSSYWQANFICGRRLF
ncbi:MAG: C40 family peptidase [Eubacteriales bacterium]